MHHSMQGTPAGQAHLRLVEKLGYVRNLWQTAEVGLEILRGENALRWIDGMRIVTVFGRSTSLALQHALADADGFAEWYAAERQAMKDDELLRWFLEARNVVLKESAVLPDMSGAFAGDGGHATLTVPLQHRGRPVDDLSLQNVASLYLTYLSDLIDRAEAWLAEREPRPGDPVDPEAAPRSAGPLPPG